MVFVRKQKELNIGHQNVTINFKTNTKIQFNHNTAIMIKRKKDKRQTLFYKTLHKKLKIELHQPHKKPWVNLDALER